MALMSDRDARNWGYELSKRANVRSGVLYPILRRMLDEDWLKDSWEDPAEIAENRPPRRYYELTAKGLSELGAILDAARNDQRFVGLVEGLACDG